MTFTSGSWRCQRRRKPAAGAPDYQLPASVTWDWLKKHVPVQFWLMVAGAAVSVFLAGIAMGQIDWVRKLANPTSAPPSAVVLSFSGFGDRKSSDFNTPALLRRK